MIGAETESRTIPDARVRRLSVHRLSVHRTVALCLAVARNPNAALVATVHSLLVGLLVKFNARSEPGCLDLHCGMKLSCSTARVWVNARRRSRWQNARTNCSRCSRRIRMPCGRGSKRTDLLLGYLALGVSKGVNVSQERESSDRTYSGCELATAAQVLALVKLDLADTSEATADTYLSA